MHITPDLIPHDQFHLGIWLTSLENPCWYYFSKKKNTNIISDNNFMETVDAPLRKLVKFLHDQHVRTTPSCSGHYKTSAAFQKIHSILEKDKDQINHKGILLKDVETGKIYHYQNKHYQLPWSELDFIQRAVEYQHRGIIGMRLGNRKKLKSRIYEIRGNGIQYLEKDNISFLVVDQEDPEQNLACWATITDYIEDIFSSTPKQSGMYEWYKP